MKLITTFAATMLAVFPLSLKADDGEQNLSEWKFAETVLGDEPTVEHLKGKVVVIEYWGVR